MIAQATQPQINTRADSPFRFLDCPITLRAAAATTNGGFGLIEHVMPPGLAAPYHVHQNEDEAFYALEGETEYAAMPGGRRAVHRVGGRRLSRGEPRGRPARGPPRRYLEDM